MANAQQDHRSSHLESHSRELHLSDCARLVEHEPGLVVGGVVDEGTSARRKITCCRGTSLAEGIIGDQPNRSSATSLRPNPEYICSREPVERSPLIVRGHPNAILHIVQVHNNGL